MAKEDVNSRTSLQGKSLRVGVIGLGAMGKQHARIYSEVPGVDLVGVADINPGTVASIAATYQTRAFVDFHELLGQQLDAVSIAVPTTLHAETGIAAASSGAGVLVEKPIADTIENAQKLVKTCQAKGVKLMVGHVERFNPVTSVVKKAIADCQILSVSIARLGPFPPRIRDVGVILDLAIHDIDLARYLTGAEFEKVHSLFSKGDRSGHENSALLSCQMSNGVLVQLTTNWLTPFKVREITVAAKEKYVKGWLQEHKVWEYQRWREDGSYVVKELTVPFAEPLKLELEAFIKSVSEGQEVPVSGEEGLKALTVALECLRPSA